MKLSNFNEFYQFVKYILFVTSNMRHTKCWINLLNISFVYSIILETISIIEASESAIYSSTNEQNIESEAPNEVCKSQGCIDAANLISYNIDESVNPCNDFYDFACGGFLKKTTIPEKKNRLTHISNLRDKVFHKIKTALEEKIHPEEPRILALVKNFYKACMNLTAIESYGLQPLWDIIDKLGGWPVVVGDTWDEDKFDWIEADSKLRQIGYNPKTILNVFVFNDLYNTTQNILYIEPLIPYVNGATLKKGLRSSVVKNYYHFMVQVAKLFGSKSNHISEEMKKALSFEIELTQAIYDTSNKTNLTIHSIKDLEIIAPNIPWIKYLNGLTEPIIRLNGSELVKARKINYLMNLNDIINKTPKRVIANYMIWRAVSESVPYLNADLRKLERRFKRQSNSNNAHVVRSKECINLLTDKKGLTVGISSLYIRKYFNNETRAAVRPILHSIADQFKNLLIKSSWMDAKTKESAIRKSEFMKQLIAYPSELLNDKTIDEYAQNLEISPDHHFNNHLNINRFHFDYSVSGLRERTDKRLWVILSDSTFVNAYYYGVNNIFALLAGILQPPLFNSDWPNYVKYGGIGFIIGHEMMHAYDSKNSLFDETGSYNPWFTDKDKKEYSNRIQCFIDQYKKYVDEELGLAVDGKLTVNENLADNVGMKVSLFAYKLDKYKYGKELLLPGLKYTPEQLFWIMSVNFMCGKDTLKHRMNVMITEVHTPDNFRTLGVMSNSPAFANAFNCSIGTPMNPEKKCILW